MRKLNLGSLLRLVGIVPLLVVAVFGSVLVLDSLRAYREFDRVSAIQDLITAAGHLTVKALNQESDASHIFAASGLERDRLELKAAQQSTNEAIGAFKDATKRRFKTASAPWRCSTRMTNENMRTPTAFWGFLTASWAT